ncbi:hypothetical protein SAMN05445060_4050 [Williamsia sterculiae]|uniref:Uncharacterized protein n=2 Tax=Williamsia sterculiae TaxID=1344003 RepID=A0A1N7HEH1_9NOCA|nr:hypothetical protein SAMN05445060_4050 [Williamsia sterculiae]
MHSTNTVPTLLDEIAGYTHASHTMAGISQANRATTAGRLLTGLVAHPTTPYEHGFRIRLEEVAGVDDAPLESHLRSITSLSERPGTMTTHTNREGHQA